MKEKIPEELRKEFEQAVLNADLDHWMVDNDRQFLDKIWDAVDKLFNQEVEKRIKERMPSEEEMLQMVAGHIPWLIASARNSKKYVNPFTSGHAFSEVIRILSENLSRELRSRMSEPNKEGR